MTSTCSIACQDGGRSCDIRGPSHWWFYRNSVSVRDIRWGFPHSWPHQSSQLIWCRHNPSPPLRKTLPYRRSVHKSNRESIGPLITRRTDCNRSPLYGPSRSRVQTYGMPNRLPLAGRLILRTLAWCWHQYGYISYSFTERVQR